MSKLQELKAAAKTATGQGGKLARLTVAAIEEALEAKPAPQGEAVKSAGFVQGKRRTEA